MPGTLDGADPDRLERSCDSIRFGAGAPGLERADVFLSTFAFEPHRHDTYAIGITTAGVQTFHYRGAAWVSLPGDLVVLHPDELHDGAAGTDDGFGYRSIYVAPELVRDALGGGSLPFVSEPVQQVTPSAHAVASALSDLDDPLSDLALAELAVPISDMLRSLSGATAIRQEPVDAAAVETAREYLAAHAREQTRSSTLEEVTSTDRFTLTRHFRRAFGTSPDRYRTLRRLDIARHAIERGVSLAQAAALAGFADQSHMTRQFKRAYGTTPGRWTALTGRSRSAPV